MTGGDGADTFIIGHSDEHDHHNHPDEIKTDLITDFQDAGDKIQFELVNSGNILFSDWEFAFNANGILIVSHELGALVKIQGLNSSVDLEEQIQITRSHEINLISEV